MQRILIALLGRTPQILTETLYALHRQGRLPDRILVLTTEAGKRMCLEQLLHPQRGRLQAFRLAFGLEASSCSLQDSDILTPSVMAGRPIEDIVTAEHSQIFYELCLETVFALSSEAGTELVFSIAGGRKTMSAALALAAQCYARAQDSMCHVLVSPQAEANPDFFFPDPEGKEEVFLSPVPFFRMREQLPAEFFRTAATLQTISGLCRTIPLQVHLDLGKNRLSCAGKEVVLSPVQLTLYAFFALQKAPCSEGALVCPEGCMACALSWEEIAGQRERLLRYYGALERKELAWGNSGILSLSAANFRSYRSKLHKLLCEKLGTVTGTALGIASGRRQKKTVYALRIPRSQISVQQKEVLS